MFKEMYLRLFNRVTDALEALTAAQQECEELYIEGSEE